MSNVETSPPKGRVRRASLYSWLGFGLALGGLLSYFTLAVHVASLRDSALLNLSMCVAGVGLSLVGFRSLLRAQPSRGALIHSGLATLLSICVASLFFIYVFDLSYRMPEAGHAPQAAQVAPDFQLPSTTGKKVRLSDYRGQPVLLTFYRGHW